MKTKQRSCLKKAVFNSILLGSLVASSLVFADCNAFIARTTPGASFQDNLDGTVTSLETRLMWQKCTQGQHWNTGSDANDPADDSCDGSAISLTWQAALNAAQSANANTALGYDDWYLPNVKELSSLVERACYDPAINSTPFPNTPTSYYWSATAGVISSPLPDTPDYPDAWYVDFDNGEMGSTRMSRATESHFPRNVVRPLSARLVRVSQ